MDKCKHGINFLSCFIQIFPSFVHNGDSLRNFSFDISDVVKLWRLHASALDCPTMRWCRTIRRRKKKDRARVPAKELLMSRRTGSAPWRIQRDQPTKRNMCDKLVKHDCMLSDYTYWCNDRN